jgi:anti-anti-sigma factor
MKRHHLMVAAGVPTDAHGALAGTPGDPLQSAANENAIQRPAASDWSSKAMIGRSRQTPTGRARGAPGASGPRSRGRSLRRGMHTLVLMGELDRVSAHTLEAEIERLCETGTGGITLDLRKLTYIDATGVAVIAFRSRLCRRRGFEFALIRGSWPVQRAFELAGLIDVLPFVGADPGAPPS